jgi:arylsulfatase A-like enzyme
LFWEYGRNDESFRYPQGRDRSPNVAMRDGHWKLLVNVDGTHVELYDVVDDRGETKNLAREYPDRAKQMTSEALTWRAGLPKPE